jgi:peptide/nickel transport system permease protein
MVKKIKRSIETITYSIKHMNVNKTALWLPFRNILFLFGRHMKNWKFALGTLFFLITISYSVIYSVTTDNHVDQVRLLYEDDGVTLIGAMPFAPTEPFFFGSDRLGFSLFDQLVIGAKYTLTFALLIAFLRVIGGLLLGAIYAFYLRPTFQRILEKAIDSIHFLPLSLISYILLRPILMPSFHGFNYSFTERILLEVMILTLLVVPLTTVLIGKEMRRVQEYEFISSAKVLGGSKFHIFWQHILPHIGPRLTILFGTQFIQVLLIFIHLGVFDFFFGGTKIMMGDPPTSLTNEWSGLIGQIGRNAIGSGRYWFLWILVAFMLAIFAMQFIVQGVKEVQQVKVGVLYKQPRLSYRRNKARLKDTKSYQLSKESFKKIEREL